MSESTEYPHGEVTPPADALSPQADQPRTEAVQPTEATGGTGGTVSTDAAGGTSGPEAETPIPEIDENDPMIWTQDRRLEPVAMPVVTPGGSGSVPPVGMPNAATGPIQPVPMPPLQPGAAYPRMQNVGYENPAYARDWQPATGWGVVPPQQPPIPPALAGAGSGAANPQPGRVRRTTALVATSVVLALAAGFGGGFLGAQLQNGSSGTAATTTAALTQQARSASTTTATGSVESVAAAVLPSVVSVVSSSQSTSGEGSGVILTDDGYILTNNHVIQGATELTVRFNDGATASATVVGTDVTGDLAVIKADGVSGLTPATLGTSGGLTVGEDVVAIGSPLGLSATVTSGIVSALNRPVRTASEDSSPDPRTGQTGQSTANATVLNAIQTDAAINPGNSGGPLVNMQGQIIGINSAIASLSSGSSQSGSIGVGFAIPIDTAARIADEIIKTGKASHAVLGASVADTSNGGLISTGATIKAVTAGGAAEAAGLQVGDVITKIDDVLVESSDALVATVRSAAPNSQVTMTVVRDNATSTVTVTLGSSTE